MTEDTGFEVFLRRSLARSRLALFLLAICGCVAGIQQPTTVILVRHAEREPLSTPDPDLTPAGRLRARALLAAAREAGIQAIIITQYTRTKATAEPLATALGITPEIVPDTGIRHAKEVADLILGKHAGQTVLVVGHGHTVPAIMRALGATMPVQRICESQYDLMFFLTITPHQPARVVRARYGAPSQPDSSCKWADLSESWLSPREIARASVPPSQPPFAPLR